jgi:nucleotide-binding universal stress UspA family protein
MSFEGVIAILVAVNLVCVVASLLIARRYGHDPFNWVLISAVIGPLGVIALLAATQRPAPSPVVMGSTDKADTLIPTDGSQYSLAAVRHYLAMRSPGSTVTLLAVLPVERKEAPESDLQQDIASHVAEARKLLTDAGIRADVATAFGDPATEIVRFATEGGFEHIVMGRRGRGGVARMVLGSVSEKVTKEAPIPVTLAG